MPDHLLPQLKAADQKVFSEGQPVSIELEIELQSGQGPCRVHCAKFPILGEDGKIVAIGGVVSDVGDIVRTEMALIESREALARAQSVAKIGNWRRSFEGRRLISYSDEFAHLHGVKPCDLKQFIKVQFEEVIHPGDRARVTEALENACALGANYEIDYRITRPNGAVRHLHEIGEVVENCQDRPVEHVGTVQDITERVRAESELRESEAKLKAIMTNAPVVISLKDLECRFVMVNEAFEENTGFKTESAIGRTAKELFGPLYGSGDAFDFQVIETGKPVRREITVPCKDGPRPYISIKFPVLDAEGSVAGVGTIMLDISEQKAAHFALLQAHDELESRVRSRTLELQLANEALRQEVEERQKAEETARASETQLRQATRMARIGVFVWDNQKEVFSYCSEELAGLMGQTVEEFLGRNGTIEGVRKAIHPDDHDHYFSTLDLASKKRRSYDVEFRVTTPDGSIRLWREQGEPVYDEAGKVSQTFGAIQDITDLRRTEDALRESEGRLRAVLDYSPATVWMKDFDGYLRVVNQRFCERYGVEREDLIGTTLDQIHAPEVMDQLDALGARLQETDEVQHEEIEVTLPDGAKRRVLFHIFRVRDREMNDIGIGSIGLDVTELREAEANLGQAQKLETVGTLTGGIANDFNNLLAIIMGNAEMLRLRYGEGEPITEELIRATRRGKELTQRLLAFSRRQALSPKSIDVAELITNLSAMMGRTLGETVAISCCSSAELWPVLVDPGQLENAVLNLAINASDAMENGGELRFELTNRKITAGEFEELAAGDYIQVIARDNGHGMKSEVLVRAFDPFFTTTSVGEGSGLGLSMVYGFLKQSGGHVILESKLGKGTAVILLLPRGEPAEDQSLPFPRKENADPLGNGERILVVEDDEDLRRLTCLLLRELGYEVEIAGSAQEAYENLQEAEKPFDLLLSDVVLPGGQSGLDLASQAESLNPSLKTVFMSGYPEQALRRKGADRSMNKIIEKPFRQSELAQFLRSVLDEPKSKTNAAVRS